MKLNVKPLSLSLVLIILLLFPNIFAPLLLLRAPSPLDTIFAETASAAAITTSTGNTAREIMLNSLTWERSISSTHFTVEYNVTGSNAVSDEYAQNIDSSLEYSWHVETEVYGFLSPPDSVITVYVMQILTGEYGLTWGMNGLGQYHVANITLNVDMSDPDLLSYVCAHELFHCIQLSYRITASWFMANTNKWVIEGTAVWMGARVYPEYIGPVSFKDWANIALATPDLPITDRTYDAVLFWMFLDEHYGGLNTIKSTMQEDESLNSIQAVNNTLNSIGTTFTQVFKEWTIANYLKDNYYTKGYLFNPVTPSFSYDYVGAEESDKRTVLDWTADYCEMSSSLIYMPVQFSGGEHNNLTKILIDHGVPLVSDFDLSTQYTGTIRLMQANNLDRIVIIIATLGTETSQSQTTYTITWLSSSQTLQGPYASSSEQTNIYLMNNHVMQISQEISPAVVANSSIENSSTIQAYAVGGESAQSSTQITSTITDETSQQNSMPTPLYLLNSTGQQNSSTKTTTIANDSSSMSSSETPLNVTSVHDLAVNSALVSKTIIEDGYNCTIYVTVANIGNFVESFNVTAYANATAIGTQLVTLTNGNSTILTFTWDTSGFDKGNYTLSAYAEPVQGETNTADNLLTGGIVKVTIVGDVNGDGKVNLIDVFAVALAYGSYPGRPTWNPNYDINNDGKINLIDYFITALNYGKTDP